MDLTTITELAGGMLESRWSEAIYAFLVVLAVLLFNAVLRWVLARLVRRAESRRHIWQSVLLKAARQPLRGLMWVIGLTAMVRILTRSDNYPLLAELIQPVLDVAAIALIAWFLFRLISKAKRSLTARANRERKEVDATAVDAISKLASAVVLVITTLLVMQSFGLPISALLALGGVGGIALGFAAQSLVANLLGGITIYASRPFKVGDHIIFPGTNRSGGYFGYQAGEVQYIGWRATRILDWNGRPFYVPNARFNTETIINHSRMAYREVSEYVYLRLQDIDKIPAIVTDVNHMLEKHPDMGDYLVFKFDGYGDYALKLYLYAYTAGTITAYTEYMRVKQDLLLEIAAIVAQHSAKLAVPVSTVYLPEGPRLRRDYESTDADSHL